MSMYCTHCALLVGANNILPSDVADDDDLDEDDDMMDLDDEDMEGSSTPEGSPTRPTSSAAGPRTKVKRESMSGPPSFPRRPPIHANTLSSGSIPSIISPGVASAAHTAAPTHNVVSPAIASSFSSTYSTALLGLEEFDDIDWEDEFAVPGDPAAMGFAFPGAPGALVPTHGAPAFSSMHGGGSNSYQIPPHLFMSPTLMTPADPHMASIDDLVRHYVQNVIGIEYLLADKATLHHLSAQLIQLTAAGNPSVVSDAVRLLAAVHRNRSRGEPSNATLTRLLLDGPPTSPGGTVRSAMEDPALKNQYRALQPLLLKDQHISTGEAFAALQIISAFLFDGGTGYRWHRWLHLACQYADGVLNDKRWTGPAEALVRADETVGFVVKTTMWFDVLASITLGKAPHFINVFRTIFGPGSSGDEQGQRMVPRQLSMMAVMGCENAIVWALAEVSALAQWKTEQLARGTLSVPELVRKGAAVEKHLTPAPAAFFTDDLAMYRQYSSEIFRASTSVYLHSVVSGDYPAVGEIRRGVREMIECLEEIPGMDGGTGTGKQVEGAKGGPAFIFSRSVIRMTVFSIFICGCLTDDAKQRNVLLTRLRQQQTLEKIGNCDGITDLLEEVWRKRDRGPAWAEVPWREALSKAEMLLV